MKKQKKQKRGIAHDIELLNVQNLLLFGRLVVACEAHGFDSAPAKKARIAYRDGVEAQIGEMYEKANNAAQKKGRCKEVKEFRRNAPRLMRLAGISSMTFYHTGAGSFQLTDRGQVLNLPCGGKEAA